jgi:hypothetical protein
MKEMNSTIVFLLLVLFGELWALSDTDFQICEGKCLKRKESCNDKCQRRSVRRRLNLEKCVSNCSSDFQECVEDCSCLSKCRRELGGCRHGCEWHPFHREWDRKQCVKECRYDNRQCKRSC